MKGWCRRKDACDSLLGAMPHCILPSATCDTREWYGNSRAIVYCDHGIWKQSPTSSEERLCHEIARLSASDTQDGSRHLPDLLRNASCGGPPLQAYTTVQYPQTLDIPGRKRWHSRRPVGSQPIIQQDRELRHCTGPGGVGIVFDDLHLHFAPRI